MPNENVQHCSDWRIEMNVFLPGHWCSLYPIPFCFTFGTLLSDRWVVLFRETPIPAWLLAPADAAHSWRQMETVETEGQSLILAHWQGGSRPKPNASLRFVQMIFVPLFFVRSREQMRGRDKGCLEDCHICSDRKDVWAKSKTGSSNREETNSECHTCGYFCTVRTETTLLKSWTWLNFVLLI